MARKLDDPAIRTTFLLEVAKGKTIKNAAKKAGISTSTVRRQIEDDEDFANQLLDAEEDSFSPVEDTVRELAIAGDGMMVKEYRSMKRRREAKEMRRTHHTEEQKVVLDASNDIKRLLGNLATRLERNREIERVSATRED